MILMITYRCTLDCDHCMIYKTGPQGEHMSEWVLESSMNVFYKTRSNQLGLAGGEPLEHPDFWDMLAVLRRSSLRKGFSIKVATSGEPFDKDSSLIEKVAKAYPVMFQVTRTAPYYEGLQCLAELSKISNVYTHPLRRYYHSRKAKERGFNPSQDFEVNGKTRRRPCVERKSVYCEPAWWIRRSIKGSLNFGAFIRLWEGYHDLCTIHVHPDGSIRMGPLDDCRSLGNVVSMSHDFVVEGRRAMVAMGEKPCRKCGIKGAIR